MAQNWTRPSLLRALSSALYPLPTTSSRLRLRLPWPRCTPLHRRSSLLPFDNLPARSDLLPALEAAYSALCPPRLVSPPLPRSPRLAAICLSPYAPPSLSLAPSSLAPRDLTIHPIPARRSPHPILPARSLFVAHPRGSGSSARVSSGRHVLAPLLPSLLPPTPPSRSAAVLRSSSAPCTPES
ncbi:hypothetical protein FA09DRAFT_14546 [Tilletiopsis washingtonensis]|uniref:Uncharacterized protein n=1 Tax=Tilletiopsis washingtonensis TaxID=58919 RepID=A0A316ZK76_9BASI|nr:hypothetical protein FA09DRAFT_14546 [Tilletiopsis washingtonensis]PWO01413.1 hypothetical protein FA09DRAFT_14546 [Tilletiopsis washingtonensis]